MTLTERLEKALRDGLRDLPELAAMAAAALPGERLGGESGGRAVPGSRPPLNVDSLALTGYRDLDHPTTWPIRDGGIVWVDGHGRVDADTSLPGSALSVLAAWTRLAEAELLDADPETWTPLTDKPTVASECAWLLRHIVWILDQPWIGELADDVRRLTADARAILRIRPTYRPRCPRCPTGVLADAGNGYWSCTECGQTHRDDRMSLRQAVALQQPMTVGELAKAFGWPTKTVESWVQRDRLQPVGPDAKPRRYHVLDALRLADAGGVLHSG